MVRFFVYFFYSFGYSRDLHSFPTRRSSDLVSEIMRQMLTQAQTAGQYFTNDQPFELDRKSGSAGMPRPISYAVFCLKNKQTTQFILHSCCITIINDGKIVCIFFYQPSLVKF